MNTIFTADLHLTDREQDEYRWQLFPWLEQKIAKYHVEYLWVLGDITDKKDDHSSALVNRIHRQLQRLAKLCRKIIILKGNHDYVDAQIPYFKFLHRSMKGKILYFHQPTEIGLHKQSYLALPHTRDWSEYAGRWKYESYDKVLIHQPVIGAVNEQGKEMQQGLALDDLKTAKVVLAGDIHKGQRIGNLVYVGAPYPVRFGDKYKPRVLLETSDENGKANPLLSLCPPSIRKEAVTISRSKQFAGFGFKAGDKVKVTVELPRAEFAKWDVIRQRVEQQCKAADISLCGFKLVEVPGEGQEPSKGDKTPQTCLSGDSKAILARYGKAKKLDAGLIQAGAALMEKK